MKDTGRGSQHNELALINVWEAFWPYLSTRDLLRLSCTSRELLLLGRKVPIWHMAKGRARGPSLARMVRAMCGRAREVALPCGPADVIDPTLEALGAVAGERACAGVSVG
jgi:hypothetical protein